MLKNNRTRNEKIDVLNTNQFLNKFMKPGPKLKKIIKGDAGQFFIVRVQDMIKISKLPVPPTRATTHTIIYLTEGVATMTIGYEKVRIGKNECLVVPAGKVFCYDKYERNKGFICNFDNDFLIGKIGSADLVRGFEFLEVWGNPVIKPHKDVASYLKQTFQRILDEYTKDGLLRSAILQSHFIAALFELHEAYGPLLKGQRKMAITLTNAFKELVHKNVKKNLRVSDFSDQLNVTPNHLNKIIKEATGKSPSKWIDEAVVTEAKVLLAHTNRSVSQVAAHLGILDQSYFSRLFKKYEKVTPVGFREKIEKS